MALMRVSQGPGPAFSHVVAGGASVVLVKRVSR